MTLPEVTLLRPLWLLALPALAAFGWWLRARRGALGGWTRAADPELIAAMEALGRIEAASRHGAAVPAPLVAAALCVLALAGPAIERRDALSFRNLDGVMFLLETSRGLSADPGWTQIQTFGRFGISALGTRPAGVVVFAGDAYVAADMTRDHLQLGQTWLLIDSETVPDRGARPERALDLAAERIAAAQVIAGDVVLFTSGAGLGPDSLRAVSAIAGRGARVSLVAPGPVTPLISAHADLGNGRVFGPDDVEAFGDWLGQEARARFERQTHPLLFWSDLGRYLLLVALVPLALMFRSEGR